MNKNEVEIKSKNSVSMAWRVIHHIMVTRKIENIKYLLVDFTLQKGSNNYQLINLKQNKTVGRKRR